MKTVLIFFPIFFISLRVLSAEISCREVPQFFAIALHAHVKYNEFTFELMDRAMDLMVRNYDPNGFYLDFQTRREISNLSGRHKNALVMELTQGECGGLIALYRFFKSKVREFHREFGGVESYKTDILAAAHSEQDLRYDLETASTTFEEQKERYLKLLASIYRYHRAIGLDEDDAFAMTAKQSARMAEDAGREVSEKEVAEWILGAFLGALDPHSYFVPATNDSMSVELFNKKRFGVGVALAEVPKGLMVMKVLEGGAASKEGTIEKSDVIVGVNGRSIEGMRHDEVTSQILGEQGTGVVLSVLKSDGTKRNVKLTRQEIVVPKVRARVEEGRNGRIGVIEIDSFYVGMPEDVETLIKDLKKEGMNGLVVDLRGNGGGAVEAAVGLTGLFIHQGPVAGFADFEVRLYTGLSPDGRRQVWREEQAILRDVAVDDGERTVWDGPLVLMIDSRSASASEVVAGALQNYGRAFIVGERSFGKGTMQGAIPVGEFGNLWVTRRMIVRPDGTSTQVAGVTPDVYVGRGWPAKTDSSQDRYGVEESKPNVISFTPSTGTRLVSSDGLGYFPEKYLENARKELAKTSEKRRVLCSAALESNGRESGASKDLQGAEAREVLGDVIWLYRQLQLSSAARPLT